MKTKRIKLKNIKLLSEITEIRPVDDLVVSRYRQAERAGANFPLYTVTTRNELVKGYHRREKDLREYGEDHVVEVYVQKYDSMADIIEDAIEDNSRHGYQLDGISRKRAILKLSEYGKDPARIAQILGVSVKRIEEVAGNTVVVVGGNGKKSRANMPIKYGLEHIRGQEVSAEQYASHIRADRGVPAYSTASQLTRWINSGWVNIEDPKTASAMEQLHAALDSLLK